MNQISPTQFNDILVEIIFLKLLHWKASQFFLELYFRLQTDKTNSKQILFFGILSGKLRVMTISACFGLDLPARVVVIRFNYFYDNFASSAWNFLDKL